MLKLLRNFFRYFKETAFKHNPEGTNTANTLIDASFQYHNSFIQESYDYIPQMPFEDEYSQLVQYDD